MIKPPQIGIVVLNYLKYNETILFVRDSLFIQKGVDLRIAIVDNGSDNGSYGYLTSEFGKDSAVKVIPLTENRGYSAGNNIGIDYLKSIGIDWIIISNSDIEIENPWLISDLYRTYNDFGDIAFIAPLMKTSGKIKYGAECWIMPTKLSGLFSGSYLLSFLYKVLNSDWHYSYSIGDPPFKADCLSGSFFGGKVSAFDSIEQLDENTFLYYEETIIGHKVKKLGLSNYIVPGLCYEHRSGSVTSDVMSYTERQRELLRSKLYYWRAYRNSGIIFLLLLKVIFVINLLEAIIISATRRLQDFISSLFVRAGIVSYKRTIS